MHGEVERPVKSAPKTLFVPVDLAHGLWKGIGVRQSLETKYFDAERHRMGAVKAIILQRAGQNARKAMIQVLSFAISVQMTTMKASMGNATPAKLMDFGSLLLLPWGMHSPFAC